MRRAVVTGIGIISCIGNNKEEVLNSLREGKSGIVHMPEFAEVGMRSHVAGKVQNFDANDFIDRKQLRFMSESSQYAFVAMQQAIADANLSEDIISNERTGLIVGAGGGSPAAQVAAYNAAKSPRGIKTIGPYAVTKTMSSGVSACLSTFFKIKGLNYTISSACSTSAHCIGNAVEQIQLGKQDVVFAGGGEELSWEMSSMFDAMGALSSSYNESPNKASRAYDQNRDGFVIAGGSAILVIEELEHALKRNAKIYAEVVGYGATSDGYDMVAPSGEGAVRCMRQALATVNEPVDYINAHGTSTPVGDLKELQAISEVFPGKSPAVSSTKSLTGHSLGAAGAQEAIYSLLMLDNNFIAASANIEQLDEKVPAGVDVVLTRRDQPVNVVMSNSFGFGGTNASLVFKRFKQ
ncbi:beta-ketoacyl-ACP synthase I [Psittacicella hinzii]|uniref:3-oxoacyl-[acyl-carrier-protein] synthase 1 n=1 Tax=Psittacicella hinzii TaxID=2028575 RepID=A0A3A1YBZ9_9GAMM|nr:beta-ketoacyl-ACP synthase I [Psittacicella hinzii]RIY34708.1 beta-ketoacyl-[acyl-carrier-protein] synthase I [Psittacicella hinzii]